MRHSTPQQQAAAKARRQRLREMVTTLAAMTDKQRHSLAAQLPGLATCEGHILSLHNQCLLAIQCPQATLVGGFRQWKAHGRSVKHGEHGHMIWVPVQPKSAETVDGDLPQPSDLNPNEKAPKMRFLIGTVFDISQTQAIADAAAAD